MEDEEKEVFVSMMRQLEAFTGIEVLTYCVMGNHFHLLVHKPIRPESQTREELIRRMEAIYSKKKMAEIETTLEEWQSLGLDQQIDAYFSKIEKRTFNLQNFMKELKNKFSKWFNNKNERCGTLWEDRYKSVLIEGQEGALMNVAAYIDLNPYRAGIVDDPGEYKYSSYYEILNGGARARENFTKLYFVAGKGRPWEENLKSYKQLLFNHASRQAGEGKSARVATEEERVAVTNDSAKSIMGEGSTSTSSLSLGKRISHLTTGAVLGGLDFLKKFYQENEEYLCPNRQKPGTRLSVKGTEGLFTYRDTRGKG